MKVAIQPDDYTPAGRAPHDDASSPRWTQALRAAGHEVVDVDVYRPDILARLRDCDGFMWRFAHFGAMSRVAKRLLPVVENELGLCVYPDQKTCWHYDDKIAQAYLLRALEIPTPRTWVFFDRAAALEWAATARYPLVAKLSAGAGSSNVQLVANPEAAERFVDAMFEDWRISLDPGEGRRSWKRRAFEAAQLAVTGRVPTRLRADREPQRGYALFQEFLPGNDFDTRITVIGSRAFGFRRKNREGDFRASGSGTIDHDPGAVDPRAIRLAFRTAAALGAQSVAIDALERAGEWVVAEVSYTYASWAVHECPGHWVCDDPRDDAALRFIEGPMWPEEAQIEDFLVRLERSALD